jgi:hypothetical protein
LSAKRRLVLLTCIIRRLSSGENPFKSHPATSAIPALSTPAIAGWNQVSGTLILSTFKWI